MSKRDDFVFVAVAMDAGGIRDAKPHYEAAKATYVTLVDSQNALGEALGFKVIPNGYLIDEAGVLQGQKVGGFEVSRQATIQMVEAFLARPKADSTAVKIETPTLEDLEQRHKASPEDPDAALAYGKALLSGGMEEKAISVLEKAASMKPTSASLFALGTAQMAVGKKDAALAGFKRALRLDRANFVIRKQIWLIEHPEKFHPTIDWDWQRQQLKKEREEEAKDPPRGGGGGLRS